MGLEVIDRCNLTVLLEPGQEDLVPFLASEGIRVVASLPCYTLENVDQQRGRGVFERSIQGLQMLNAAGESELSLKRFSRTFSVPLSVLVLLFFPRPALMRCSLPGMWGDKICRSSRCSVLSD